MTFYTSEDFAHVLLCTEAYRASTAGQEGRVGVYVCVCVRERDVQGAVERKSEEVGEEEGRAESSSPRERGVQVLKVKMSLRKQTPSDFLKQIIGRPVVVKLNSGVDYRGVLACLDGYMNIAVEQTEEYVNGQLKNKYGDAFLRGNNVLYISTQKRKM
ncbi:hypothetical protein NFI96_018679 [Prochilodus magdalenae]|nr:hypothetical protein NFI96_018679 [Prochilodus magdalenae]